MRIGGALWAAVVVWVGASFSADAALSLANNGVGFIRPTIIPPSGLNYGFLNNMVDVYNGVASSPISGENYYVVKGTSTPEAPKLPQVDSLDTEIVPTVANGYGKTSAWLDLGSGGYNYLVAQWDGPNGADAVYYIAGMSGKVKLINDLPVITQVTQNKKGQTVISTLDLSKYGLSGYWLSESPEVITLAGAAVPEPTAILAGSLLLLPFGLSTLRRLQKLRRGEN